MDAGLVPVIAASGLIAATWTGLAARAVGAAAWPGAALAAGAIAGVLVAAAAYAPADVLAVSLGVPALTLAAGALLQVLFARPVGLGLALAGALALLIFINPGVFPVAMPLVLALPLWTVAWVDRGSLRLVALSVASLVLVPLAVIGTLLLIAR